MFNRYWLFFFVSLLGSQPAQAAKVKLMVESYAPYMTPELADNGVMTNLVVEALARMKVKSTIEFSSWIQVEQQIDHHRVLSFMWQKSKPQLKKWHYSNAFYAQRKRFFARTDFNKDISRLHDLRGVKIGLTEGFGYGRQIDDIRSKLSVKTVSSDYLLLQSLLNKKVDLIAIDPLVAVYLVNKHYGEKKQQLRFIQTPHFNSMPFYLVCAKEYGNCLSHIKKFNKGLDMLIEDGTRATLIKRAESLQ